MSSNVILDRLILLVSWLLYTFLNGCSSCSLSSVWLDCNSGRSKNKYKHLTSVDGRLTAAMTGIRFELQLQTRKLRVDKSIHPLLLDSSSSLDSSGSSWSADRLVRLEDNSRNLTTDWLASQVVFYIKWETQEKQLLFLKQKRKWTESDTEIPCNISHMSTYTSYVSSYA